jgi:hypothetical protein
MKSLSITVLAMFVYAVAYAQSPDKIHKEVWQRELQYWKYVLQNVKLGYLTLWHENFIGYPDTDSLIRKNKIGNWIAGLFSKKDLRYENKLIKKAVNVFGDH